MLLLNKNYNYINKQKLFLKLSRGLRVVGRGGRGGFRDAQRMKSCTKSGKQLRDVVENGKNEQWKVIPCAALDPNDAHDIDIKYHLKCWLNHVQRANSEVSLCSSNILIICESRVFPLDTVSPSFWF